MALGVGLGLIWYIKPVSKSPTVSRERLNIAAITITGAIFGGRIGHVLMNMTYFQAHLVETVQVWLGGFSWIGFTVGAFIAIYIATRIKGIPFLKTTDDLTPLFTTTAVFIWLACWITGYAYGTKVDAWWGIPTSNEWGELTQRWPTQLLGGVTILSLQLLIEYSRKQKLLLLK